MPVQLTKLQAWFMIILAILIISFLWLIREVAPAPLSDKEKIVIETLFDKAKPQCIGRYVIDVPASFNNKLQDKIFIDDFKIESKFIYPPAFQQRIELREKELIERTTSKENAPVLKEVIQLPDGKGVIFDSNRSGTDDAYRTLEAHVYDNHIAFIITTNILDLSAPKYADEKKSYIEVSGFSEIETNTRPTKLAAMQSLISRLSGRLDHVVPTENGVCIPNGFILDDNSKQQEDIYFLYENSDFSLAINMDHHETPQDEILLNKSFEIKKAMALNNMHTFKKGEIKPNGVPAQEWLMYGRQKIYNKENNEESGFPYYSFLLKVNQGTSSFAKPFLSITLFNNDKETTYSDAEMVEIWDRIVGSLRYKPNAF
ncbi:T6SS immunity protein Tli4 family protein [Providencia alcalifaciens]|uniref:T6SS immunity protein Tli4 family protein n=1 Tax=Providencia alcalifaciens TaxID=126385 RepID=UPI00055C3491|nr:T6SS immunity protein Tli4 family protein [Providencia alcalifaciens]MTC14562.1 hypothetical protein [Providencia alcalifaciens]MTC29036.1 hypothetical protein [Providencia alcalifaciens]MTC63990.1 hypothetical protein [Providencia alcalifaciens]WGZ54241.1 T6SS immunity protein Tli4 family protein [Providencia alcalifaciens]